MKWSGIITNDQMEVHAKGQCQRSKVKVPEVKIRLNHFRAITPVWIQIWWWNDAQSLNCLEEVPYCFWPKLGVSGLSLQLEYTDVYESKLKARSNIEEVPYCFTRSSIKFQGHTGQKIADFDPNWAFPDCSLSFNLPMALKWCTKLDVV